MLCFIASLIFFFTAFRRDDCYSEECPQQIRSWMLLTFFAFYFLQGLTYALFRIKSRVLAFWVFMLSSCIVMPCMLGLNIWGNTLIEEMDKRADCTYLGYA